MEEFDHILLFKTDICDEERMAELQPTLDSQEGIVGWNVALDDEDFVLRVVSYTLKHHHIIKIMSSKGYFCCELT